MTKAIGTLIGSLYSISFYFFDTKIDLGDLGSTLAQFLTLGLFEIDSSSTYSSIWNIATVIYSILSPIAISIVVLFFMLEIISMARDFNRITWERLIMKVLKFCICIYIINIIPTILDGLTRFAKGFYQDISLSYGSGNVPLGASLEEAINQYYDDVSLMTGLVAAVLLLMGFGAYVGTAVAAIMAVFQRFIRLVFLRGIAPVPIAMMSYSGTRDLAKRYLMNFTSCLLEAGFILIILYIYSLGVASIKSNVLNIDASTNTAIVEAADTGSIASIISAATVGKTAGAISIVAELVISVSLMNALLTGGISLASRVVSDSLGASPQ